VCCVGANLDDAAVADPRLFSECLRDGFAEVLALTPTKRKPSLLR